MKFHKDGTSPQNHEVFVFGSNLAGKHGAGAAKFAFDNLGAEYGKGEGPTRNCYAIPTKDAHIVAMDLCHIIPGVKTFVQYTLDHPELEFFVTRVGCGFAGYKDKEMAPLFKGCGDNCNFAEEWRQYLEV